MMKKTSYPFYKSHKLNIDLYNSANEWIKVSEAVEILGNTHSAISTKVSRSNIPIQVIKKAFYFRKLDYMKLYFVIETDAVEFYNLPLNILKKLVNEGIVNTIELDGDIYYHKKFNEKHLKFGLACKSIVEMSNRITIDEAYKVCVRSYKNYEDFISYAFSNRDKYSLTFNFENRKWYVSNSITGIRRKIKITKKQKSIYHEKIEIAYNYVSELFDSYEDFKKVILSHKDKYDVINYYKHFYVNLSKILFTPENAAKELNVSYVLVRKWEKEGFFNTVSLCSGDRGKLIISLKNKTYKDYIEFRALKDDTLPKIPIEEFESEADFIKYNIKWISEQTEFKDSVKWIGYSILSFSEQSQATRSKFDATKSYLLFALRMVKSLKKEIYDCNNDEISKLYDDALKKNGDIKKINMFLKYIMHKKLDCKYNTLPKQYNPKKDHKNVNDRFSVEIVERYFHYLSDLDRHFFRAINSYRYAQLWLIAILHQSLARRIGDIINTPMPDIELVNIYSFDDLYNRDITMSDMEIIIDNIKAKSYGQVTSKTAWNLAFVKDIDLITQTGIAFVICELHRREKKKNILFASFIRHNPSGDDWKYFFDDELLKGFGSLKANRSFLNDIYKYASKSSDLKALSYSLITKFRAHRTDGINESEVTKAYLEITKFDGFQDKIIYNVQRIGAFGFLYNLLTELAYDTKEIPLHDQISYLEELKEKLSKKSIESLATFLSDTTENLNKITKGALCTTEIARELLESKFKIDMKCYNEHKIAEQISLAKEIVRLSKKEIRGKLEGIFKNELNSKNPYCYCFKGITKCEKHSSSPVVCILCKYCIPTVYALSSFKVNIGNLFEKIESTPLNNKQMLFKYKMILFKYIGVISEVYKEFAKYDEAFINSFINLPELKKQVIELENNIFNKVGGLR